VVDIPESVESGSFRCCIVGEQFTFVNWVVSAMGKFLELRIATRKDCEIFCK
jgi:hypothetical protein